MFPFVEEVARFALSGSNVSISFHHPENLWSVNFDKNQIGQVVDNIIINAKQAMFPGGTIRVTVNNVVRGYKNDAVLANGNYVRLSIMDTGVGISKQILPKIFDPFFTTKKTGQGLGLATSHSIINRHGGRIDVESEQGKGSVFHIFLPALGEEPENILDTRWSARKTGKRRLNISSRTAKGIIRYAG